MPSASALQAPIDEANVASGGDVGSLRCPRSYTSTPSGSSVPSREALLWALRIYFGADVVPGGTNPWPEAQVQALVKDGWVDEQFIAPWMRDARHLAASEFKTRSALDECPLPAEFLWILAPSASRNRNASGGGGPQ
jgi:hypothetical protein